MVPLLEVVVEIKAVNVKFTYWFILDRNLKILLLSYPERDQSLTAANSTILLS